MKDNLLFMRSVIAALVSISLANINLILSITALSVTICYTLRKWYLLEKSKKNG